MVMTMPASSTLPSKARACAVKVLTSALLRPTMCMCSEFIQQHIVSGLFFVLQERWKYITRKNNPAK